MSGGAFFPVPDDTRIAAYAQGHHVFINRCDGQSWCLDWQEARQLERALNRIIPKEEFK